MQYVWVVIDTWPREIKIIGAFADREQAFKALDKCETFRIWKAPLRSLGDRVVAPGFWWRVTINHLGATEASRLTKREGAPYEKWKKRGETFSVCIKDRNAEQAVNVAIVDWWAKYGEKEKERVMDGRQPRAAPRVKNVWWK